MREEQSGFVDLAVYTAMQPDPTSARGNVIKARHVATTGTQQIEVSVCASDQSTIVTHRDGDVIRAIEVICVCGASTTISLEYEHQLQKPPAQ